jgi:hypothetical protein
MPSSVSISVSSVRSLAVMRTLRRQNRPERDPRLLGQIPDGLPVRHDHGRGVERGIGAMVDLAPTGAGPSALPHRRLPSKTRRPGTHTLGSTIVVWLWPTTLPGSSLLYRGLVQLIPACIARRMIVERARSISSGILDEHPDMAVAPADGLAITQDTRRGRGCHDVAGPVDAGDDGRECREPVLGLTGWRTGPACGIHVAVQQLPARGADVLLEAPHCLYCSAVVLDLVNAALPGAIRTRDAETILDLALGQDDEFFTDRDIGEAGVDDGGMRIVADLVQQRGQVLMAGHMMLHRDAERELTAAFLLTVPSG